MHNLASSNRGIVRPWSGKSELQSSLARSGGRVVVLASGGLDSCVLLACVADVASEVYPLFVRNGHPWEDAEVAGLRRFVEALDYPNLRAVAEHTLPVRDLLDTHWGAHKYHPGFSDGLRANFIPGRNLALVSVASLFSFAHSAGALAIGLLDGNPYPDASRRFFSAFEALYAVGLGQPLRILTPFAKLPKEEVVRIGEGLPLELSLSCVNPIDGQHCGDGCNKCAERQKAYALAGIPDPTIYRNPPPRMDWKTHKWPD